MEVHALVALEPDQPRSRGARQRFGGLGLPDAGLALEQQWLLELRGEEDCRRERAVREIALGGERFADGVDGRERRLAQAAAFSSARRASTRARCRLYSGVAFRSPGGSVP